MQSLLKLKQRYQKFQQFQIQQNVSSIKIA